MGGDVRFRRGLPYASTGGQALNIFAHPVVTLPKKVPRYFEREDASIRTKGAVTGCLIYVSGAYANRDLGVPLSESTPG